jgi:hypothetical protein
MGLRLNLPAGPANGRPRIRSLLAQRAIVGLRLAVREKGAREGGVGTFLSGKSRRHVDVAVHGLGVGKEGVLA